MAQFGAVDVALTLAVERLERLEELGERARVVVRVRVDRLEDRQNLLELVRLLSCIRRRHSVNYSSSLGRVTAVPNVTVHRSRCSVPIVILLPSASSVLSKCVLFCCSVVVSPLDGSY